MCAQIKWIMVYCLKYKVILSLEIFFIKPNPISDFGEKNKEAGRELITFLPAISESQPWNNSWKINWKVPVGA